jgi:hypothetical protein
LLSEGRAPVDLLPGSNIAGILSATCVLRPI